MSTFQLTRSEIRDRDDLVETIKGLAAEIGDANATVRDALDERERRVGAYNDAAERWNSFLFDLSCRLGAEGRADMVFLVSTMLQISSIGEIELKFDDLDHDTVFDELDQLVDEPELEDA